jgi:hypothetical protein
MQGGDKISWRLHIGRDPARVCARGEIREKTPGGRRRLSFSTHLGVCVRIGLRTLEEVFEAVGCDGSGGTVLWS